MDTRPQKASGRRGVANAPRSLALSVEEASAALSLSRDSFERHVMPGIRLIRVGRRLLVPVAEIERWIELNSAIPLLAELSGGAGGE